MSEFYFSEDKLWDDTRYLNNQPNIVDRSKSIIDVLNAKTGLNEIKIVHLINQSWVT